MSDNPYTRVVDRMTTGLGRFISWLALAMVLIGAYNAIVRYLGRFIGINLSSNLYLELQWYLFSLIFLLGAGFALKENAHGARRRAPFTAGCSPKRGHGSTWSGRC